MNQKFEQADSRYEQRVVVAALDSPWEAELACSRLETEGFRATLADDNLIRMDWFVARAVGGIKVLVPESEAAAARALLDTPADLPEIGLATGDDHPDALLCPNCGSDNLVRERFSRGGFVGSFLLLGFPLPILRRRWRCGRCSRLWRGDQLA